MNETTTYKPKMREFKMPAVATRLALEKWPAAVYQFLTKKGRVMYDYAIAAHFIEHRSDEMAGSINDALAVLVEEGLVHRDGNKVSLMPIEQIANDRHFMAALAVRW